MNCIICLNDCNTDVELYKCDSSSCICKYNVHFECIQYYIKNNKCCLMCKREIFLTNYDNDNTDNDNTDNDNTDNDNIILEVPIENNNTRETNQESIREPYYFNEFCENNTHKISLFFILIVLILFMLPLF
jgi:hypothetical protein